MKAKELKRSMQEMIKSQTRRRVTRAAKPDTRHVCVKDRVARTMTVENALNSDEPTVIEGDYLHVDARGQAFVEESLGDDEQGDPIFNKFYFD